MTATEEYAKIRMLMKKNKISVYRVAQVADKPYKSIEYSLKKEVDKISTIALILGAIQKIINDKNKK